MQAQLAQLSPHTQAEEDIYDFWVSTDRKCLPRAGGFLDQPAHIIASFKLLDLKHRITDQINRIEVRANEEAKKILKNKKDVEEIDDSLVRPPKQNQ